MTTKTDTEQERAEFEAWITSPPYEKPVTINQDSSGWPGQYQAYEVQLAWEAYQAGRAEPEREAEPWIPVSERLLDAYAQISKGAERMSNRDCKHGQLARPCNICELEEELNEKAKTIAALEWEVEELRGYITAAANRAGLAWHQGNTDSAVFWRAALVGIERDLRKALAGGEAG